MFLPELRWMTMNSVWLALAFGILIALAALLNNQRLRAIPYRYSSIPTSHHVIRLLRLMPNKDKTAALKCQLFDYTLESDQSTHVFEALSYAWGDPDKTVPIFISGYRFQITLNLHAALRHLRDQSIERFIWVDAICINQADDKEKEQQIQFIAKVYSQANRVIVWLGDSADNSDHALQGIRVAARDKSPFSSKGEKSQKAILKLLDRQWFRRIWVLQEVAAARHVLIVCGSTSIDGHAFCLGLDALKDIYKVRPELQGLVSPVASLIRGAIFRPICATVTPSGRSLDICPLGELIDMYHTHKATRRHDKVYALLGMSSDDLSKAGLLPNYGLPWEKLLQRLTKYLLHKNIWVETWSGTEMAMIKGKGVVLGRISTQRNSAFDNRQNVDVKFGNTSGVLGNVGKSAAHWNLQHSAKPIQDGDLICLLQGTSNPTIIRPYNDYFAIILISVKPEQTAIGEIVWPELLRSHEHFNRDFLLVWNWETPTRELEHRQRYKSGMETRNQIPGCVETESEKTKAERYLDKSTRTWDVGLILGDSGEQQKAEERLQEAIKGYEEVFGKKRPHILHCQYGLTPLSWAAGNGHEAIVDFLLTKSGVNPDLEDSQCGLTPLSWAARNGHTIIVKQLLETRKVNIDAKDTRYRRTPLSWAAGNGHEAIVKELLGSCKVEIDVKDSQWGRTPLSWAAEGGHEAIIKLLLKTRKVNVDAKDRVYEATPLSWAARNGHKTVVKLLLETGEVDVNTKASESLSRWTPLQFAKCNRHEAVVRLLQSYINDRYWKRS